MKKRLYSPPEEFSLTPLLTLLPQVGELGKLEAQTSSLFARYEKVTSLQRELGEDQDREASRRFHAEATMLRQVLDWLAVKPGGNK